MKAKKHVAKIICKHCKERIEIAVGSSEIWIHTATEHGPHYRCDPADWGSAVAEKITEMLYLYEVHQIIESPCINKCKLENNHCIGCKRSSDEIKNWITMTHNQRQEVMKRLHEDK